MDSQNHDNSFEDKVYKTVAVLLIPVLFVIAIPVFIITFIIAVTQFLHKFFTGDVDDDVGAF